MHAQCVDLIDSTLRWLLRLSGALPRVQSVNSRTGPYSSCTSGRTGTPRVVDTSLWGPGPHPLAHRQMARSGSADWHSRVWRLRFWDCAYSSRGISVLTSSSCPDAMTARLPGSACSRRGRRKVSAPATECRRRAVHYSQELQSGRVSNESCSKHEVEVR